MTTKQIIDEMEKELSKSEYHNSDAVGSCEIGLTGAGECNCGIQDLKKSIHSYTSKLIGAVAEEIIGSSFDSYAKWREYVNDKYEKKEAGVIQGYPFWLTEQQRLKVKEILSSLEK